MKQKSILFWTPRILGLLFAAFCALFALNAPGEGQGFWRTALGLAMHLAPTALALGTLAIAWRWEWLGALLYLGLGAWYTLATLKHPSWILTIAGPAFLIGALFLLSWLWPKNRGVLAPGRDTSA